LAISQETAALLADEFTADVLGTAGGHLLPAIQLPGEIQAAPVKPLYEVENLVIDGAVDWAPDDGGVNHLDSSSVDRMLASSVKQATASKYGRIWDKWAAFATFHEVEIMPPEVRALEIFIVDSAEFSGSSGVALTAAAAVAHFCALQGFGSPCEFPRFGKLLRGIRLTHGKAVKAKEPFSPAHIVTFMDLARKGTLREWRAALPLALCFQQLLRGVECFDLNGSNVSQHADFFRVTVETSKNHPEGFSFWVKVDNDRPNCVGRFMADFIEMMGIKLGDDKSFFACQLTQTGGVLRAAPTCKVASSTMRNACKLLIVAASLNPVSFATHSSKRGGRLEAMKQGLTDIQIQELGRWSSASMVARYVRGSEVARDNLAEATPI
jgi:hypothetical protein